MVAIQTSSSSSTNYTDVGASTRQRVDEQRKKAIQLERERIAREKYEQELAEYEKEKAKQELEKLEYEKAKAEAQRIEEANIQKFVNEMNKKASFFNPFRINTQYVTAKIKSSSGKVYYYSKPVSADQQKEYYKAVGGVPIVSYKDPVTKQLVKPEQPITVTEVRQQLQMGAVAEPKVTTDKTLEERLIDKGYSKQDVTEFIRQVETSPAGTSYRVQETDDRVDLVNVQQERAEKLISEGSTLERMGLYTSTVFSSRGLELLSKTVIKGKETPDDVIARHVVDAQRMSKENFMRTTARGSVMGSPTGLLGVSMLGGAVGTTISKSAPVINLISKYPTATSIIGTGVGTGAKVGYFGIKGIQIVQNRDDPQKIGEILMRTGIEYGGFKLGAKLQEQYLTKKQPVSVSVSVGKQKVKLDEQQQTFKTQADVVSKSGNQFVKSQATTSGKYTDTGEYGGTWSDESQTFRLRPELSTRAGENVYQVKTISGKGGLGGAIEKIGVDPVTERPVYRYDAIVKGTVDNNALKSIQSGLSKELYTIDRGAIVTARLNGEPYVFTKTDVYKVAGGSLSWVTGTPKPTVDISATGVRVYKIPTEQEVLTRLNEFKLLQYGGETGKISVDASKGLRTLFTDTKAVEVGEAVGTSALQSSVETTAMSTPSKLFTTQDTSLFSGVITTLSAPVQDQDIKLKPLTKSATETIEVQETDKVPKQVTVPKTSQDVKQSIAQTTITTPIQTPVQTPIQETITEPIYDTPTTPVFNPPAPIPINVPKTIPFIPFMPTPDFDTSKWKRKGIKPRRSVYTEKTYGVMELPEFIGVGLSKKKTKKKNKRRKK